MRLTLHNFRAWLSAKPAAEIVGKRKDCHDCPMARFFSESGPEVTVFDKMSGIYVSRGSRSRRLPGWACRFVRRADRLAAHDITAACALETLQQETAR